MGGGRWRELLTHAGWWVLGGVGGGNLVGSRRVPVYLSKSYLLSSSLINLLHSGSFHISFLFHFHSLLFLSASTECFHLVKFSIFFGVLLFISFL